MMPIAVRIRIFSGAATLSLVMALLACSHGPAPEETADAIFTGGDIRQ
jgi:hypothetical protein